MIINIRGTSGSGKTVLMRHFLNSCNTTEDILIPGKKKVEAIHCDYHGEDVFVLGSYKNNCGGCDTIPSQDLVCKYINKYKERGHVIFEGLMISHIYERYASQAREDISNWVFFMLETPFEQCLNHIKLRRESQGNMAELKDSVSNNARRTFDSTYRIRKKLTDEDISWEELPMQDRFEIFDTLIGIYL